MIFLDDLAQAIIKAACAARDKISADLEAFADQCQDSALNVAKEMTECANANNLSIVEAYRQAANIARVGADFRNENCTNCHDTRGGGVNHTTAECTWNPPEGMFEDKDQCYGRDLIQVGWMGPYGIIPGGMDNEPYPKWKPVYMKRGI